MTQEMKIETDYNLCYLDLVELIRSAGYPSKITLHPESFNLAKCVVGLKAMWADDQGEFFWINKTLFRPSYSEVQKRESLNISETYIMEWLSKNRK